MASLWGASRYAIIWRPWTITTRSCRCRGLAANATPLDETTVRELHRRIVFRSQPEIGGIYSTLPRRIAGSPVVFPNAVKIPGLMKEYGEWLVKAAPEPAASFDAHFRLVAIHPFA